MGQFRRADFLKRFNMGFLETVSLGQDLHSEMIGNNIQNCFSDLAEVICHAVVMRVNLFTSTIISSRSSSFIHFRAY